MVNIVAILSGLFMNLIFERFAKESWVLKSTMEKSLKMVLTVLDESQSE